jgi:hypothetical protein
MIDEALTSVGGRAEESDGKTAAGVRTVSLDAFAVAAPQQHLAMVDVERQAFGAACPADGWYSSGRTDNSRAPTHSDR